MKKLYVGILLIACLLVVVLFFSQKTTKYECSGFFQKSSIEKSIFLKLEEYRFWVSLWGDGSKGMLWIEVPGTVSELVTDIRVAGDYLQLYGYKGEIKGQFSKLSKHISIKISNDFYDGQCKEIK